MPRLTWYWRAWNAIRPMPGWYRDTSRASRSIGSWSFVGRPLLLWVQACLSVLLLWVAILLYLKFRVVVFLLSGGCLP